MALDAAGNLYVVDWLKDRVLKLAVGTGAPTVLPITAIEGPEGVAVDGEGNVYVADFENGRVIKLIAATGTQTTAPFFGLVNPWGVAVDGPGNVYVTDAGTAGWCGWRQTPEPRRCCRFPPSTVRAGWRWMAPGISTSPRAVRTGC